MQRHCSQKEINTHIYQVKHSHYRGIKVECRDKRMQNKEVTEKGGRDMKSGIWSWFRE